jgi:hypothetical protein
MLRQKTITAPPAQYTHRRELMANWERGPTD